MLRANRSRLNLFVVCLALPLSFGWIGAGCVEQTLTVKSDPPGALLYLNGMEVGRTPAKHDFTWYGTYDVELRRDGYETLKTTGEVIAPWWQWFPIDLLSDLAPFRLRDDQYLYYMMKPASTEAADPTVMLNRATQMRGQLESSEHTHPATTQFFTTAPTTRHAKTRSSSGPSSQPTLSTQPTP